MEVSAADFQYNLDDIINEYRTLRITAEGEDLERIDEMLEACETLNNKTLEEIFNLVDTGAFNTTISAYCKRVMREVGVSDEKIEEALENLEELYKEPAESIVIEELSIEMN